MATEQDIKEICARALASTEATEFDAAITELQTALREHLLESENQNIYRFLETKKISDKIKSGTED